MSFVHLFTSNLSTSVGQPTKASEYNKITANADANKERFLEGHYFNNTGVVGEDGYHRADFSDPLWFLAKTTGNTTNKYAAVWLDNTSDSSPSLRLLIQDDTASVGSMTSGSRIGDVFIASGTVGANKLFVSDGSASGIQVRDNLTNDGTSVTNTKTGNAGFVVDSSGGSAYLTLETDADQAGLVYFSKASSQSWKINNDATTGNLSIRKSDDATMFRFNQSGDTEINGSLIPISDSTSNLGSTGPIRFANLYVDSIGDTGQALAITAGSNNVNITAGTLALTGAQTISSTLAVDTDTLYVDVSNDRVGINQSSPTASLTVQAAHNTLHAMKIENAAGNVVQETYIDGSGNGVLNIRNSAGLHKMQFSTFELSFINAGFNFGVGTSSPTKQLTVYSASNDEEVLRVGNSAGASGSTQGITYIGLTPWNSGTHAHARIGVIEASIASYQAHMVFQTRNVDSDSEPTERMRITNTGQVQILSDALAINGQNSTHEANSIHIGQEGSGLAQFRAYGPDTSNRGSIEFATDLSNGTAKVRHITLKDVSGESGVGVGTQSPLARVHTSMGTANLSSVTNNTQAVFEHTAAAGSVSRVAIIGGQGSGFSVLDFADTTRSGNTDNGNITYNHADERMTFATDVGTTRIAVDSDGLKFGLDTASANALDDYEEGTWTPAFFDDTTLGLSYSEQQGSYTKIGRLVYAKFRITVSAKTGGSSGQGFFIKNLPFSIAYFNTTVASLSGTINAASNITDVNEPENLSFISFSANQTIAYMSSSAGSLSANDIQANTVLEAALIYHAQ